MANWSIPKLCKSKQTENQQERIHWNIMEYIYQKELFCIKLIMDDTEVINITIVVNLPKMNELHKFYH